MQIFHPLCFEYWTLWAYSLFRQWTEWGSSEDSPEEEPISWEGWISKWMTPELFYCVTKYHIRGPFISFYHKQVF